jgi:hypothetical protein
MLLQANSGLHEAWGRTLWTQVAEGGAEPVSTVSVDPVPGRTALALLTGYRLLFTLAFMLGQEARVGAASAVEIVAIATVWAAWRIGGIKLLFQPNAPASNRFSATSLLNRNRSAAFANLAFVLIMIPLGVRLTLPKSRELQLSTATAEAMRSLLETGSLLHHAGPELRPTGSINTRAAGCPGTSQSTADEATWPACLPLAGNLARRPPQGRLR